MPPFDFIKRVRLNEPLQKAQSTLFQVGANGKLSLVHEASVQASSFEDYSLEKLISAGVDPSDGKSFDTIDLNTADSVDDNVSKILESENIKSSKID